MSNRILTNGKTEAEMPDYRDTTDSGQQKAYVVLTEEERSKGFVRPVRKTYKHLICGSYTGVGRALAETYARDPNFYTATYCSHCQQHFPVGQLGEFVWEGTNDRVGT